MNEQTELLKQFQEAEAALEAADGLPLSERKELYQARNTAQRALTDSLSAVVPFHFLRKGEVAATVRTMGMISSPGPILNYSDVENAAYTFGGVALLSVDEIKPLEQ